MREVQTEIVLRQLNYENKQKGILMIRLVYYRACIITFDIEERTYSGPSSYSLSSGPPGSRYDPVVAGVQHRQRFETSRSRAFEQSTCSP